MADTKNCQTSASTLCGFGSGRSNDLVCIDTYRVLDSCRDKDCFEDARVYLTGYGQEIIERTQNVRVKCANVAYAYIDTETVPFNRGFYQLIIKIYVRLRLEACVCPGNPQDFDGVAVVEKRVILFGGEGGVNVFKSNGECSGFCSEKSALTGRSGSDPVATLEIADPIVLSVRVAEPGCRCLCCCGADEVPDSVARSVNGSLVDDSRANKLLVTLGFFSVIRLSRPTQLLVSATEYAVPDKECVVSEEEDPCALFKAMQFPVAEFTTSCVTGAELYEPRGKRCCGKD